MYLLREHYHVYVLDPRNEGSSQRECMDFIIPLRILCVTVREWVSHYNRGRPRPHLGPGIP